MSHRDIWNERYAGRELVWSAGPNAQFAQAPRWTSPAVRDAMLCGWPNRAGRSPPSISPRWPSTRPVASPSDVDSPWTGRSQTSPRSHCRPTPMTFRWCCICTPILRSAPAGWPALSGQFAAAAPFSTSVMIPATSTPVSAGHNGPNCCHRPMKSAPHCPDSQSSRHRSPSGVSRPIRVTEGQPQVLLWTPSSGL